MGKKESKLVIPVKTFPYGIKCLYLTQDDKELISLNFDRLDRLCNYPDSNEKDKHFELSHEEVDDIFLLLTTCRNRWYTLNAMYVEAVKWSQEGKDCKGFTDALDRLRVGISGKKSLVDAANKASKILENTAEYLSEFLKKWNLYFQRFKDVHAKLSAYCESIPVDREKDLFKERFVKYGNGPSPDDRLEPPSMEQPDNTLEFLLSWFGVARPLTSLARTYISEVLECGAQHEKSFEDYLSELQAGLQVWNKYGYQCSGWLPREAYSWRLKSARPYESPSEEERVFQFIEFCEKICQETRIFLEEKLPGKDNLKERFLLKKPTGQQLEVKKSKMKEKEMRRKTNKMNNSTEKIKILLFAANPKNTSRLALDEEIRNIDNEIRKVEYRDLLDIIPKLAACYDDVQLALLEIKPHIVHFSAHGSPTNEILLKNDQGNAESVSIDALQQLFRILKDNIRGVVFNACYSQVQAEAVTRHIDFAIGINGNIADKAAIQFASSFYRAIGFNRSIKQAFDLGINTLQEARIPPKDMPILLVRKGLDPSNIFLLSDRSN